MAYPSGPPRPPEWAWRAAEAITAPTAAEPAAQLVSGTASHYNESRAGVTADPASEPSWPGNPYRSRAAGVTPFIMTVAFAFTRRRFLAFVGGTSALLLARCAPVSQRADSRGNGAADTYSGPFFSDGSGFVE
jgi:hypothetical protein